MSNKVTLTLNGRAFTVACDEGQEKRVQYLGQYIDQKLRDVARSTGPNTAESYQWLLTSMMLADELLTAREKLDTVAMDTKQVDTKTQRQNDIDLAAVQQIASRIEELAEKLKVAG
ncbi:MAG: cell division protein ZapA [Alphaproteobacteria bacterium]|nr:cell division protein ZapA [Alphaproteobacteria bacterium]